MHGENPWLRYFTVCWQKKVKVYYQNGPCLIPGKFHQAEKACDRISIDDTSWSDQIFTASLLFRDSPGAKTTCASVSRVFFQLACCILSCQTKSSGGVKARAAS